MDPHWFGSLDPIPGIRIEIKKNGILIGIETKQL
jgi:hypothetical protein